jgi:hypothetical protein
MEDQGRTYPAIVSQQLAVQKKVLYGRNALTTKMFQLHICQSGKILKPGGIAVTGGQDMDRKTVVQ